MAKGLLFALVRKGSKLNYLEDARTSKNTQCYREQKVDCERSERANSRFEQSHKHGTASGNAIEDNSTQQTISSKEKRYTRKKLFDLTLQKISKGCKINRSLPACSNNRISTENAFTQRDAKTEQRNKPMLVPSVATGYFVKECDDSCTSKETNSKKNGYEKNMPRIVLTDHDAGNNSSPACKSLDNRLRVQYSRYGSLPLLRVDEKRKRPSSWTGDSSPRLNDFTERRPRIKTNCNLEAEQSRGLWVEAVPILASPSAQRKKFGSANSLRGQSRQAVRPETSFERSGWPLNLERDAFSLQSKTFVKRASSWSRGDERVGDLNSAGQNKKIDIFLPMM